MPVVNPGIRRFLGSAIQRLFNSASFFAPLTHSAIPTRAASGTTATFTRATTATVRDNEGVLRTAIAGEARFEGARRVRNLLATTSENLSNAAWTKGGTTLITTGVTDPLGTTRACTITGNGGDGLAYQAITPPAATGYVAVNSAYIRRRTGTGAVYLRRADNVNTDITSTLTTEWQRFETAAAVPAAGSWYFVLTVAVAGDAIDVAFCQCEDVTAQTTQTAGEYVSVGVESAPYYHGSFVDGVKCFPTDLAGNALTTMLGYLAEGARTNLVWPSEDLTHVRYVSGGGGIAVVADQAVAPDGTTTADQLTASGANGTLIQDLGVIASAAQAFSLYLKRKTGTGNIDITLDGGATWTTQAITTTEWTRCQITQTVANPDVGIRIVTSGDAIYAWGLQCE